MSRISAVLLVYVVQEVATTLFVYVDGSDSMCVNETPCEQVFLTLKSSMILHIKLVPLPVLFLALQRPRI